MSGFSLGFVVFILLIIVLASVFVCLWISKQKKIKDNQEYDKIVDKRLVEIQENIDAERRCLENHKYTVSESIKDNHELFNTEMQKSIDNIINEKDIKSTKNTDKLSDIQNVLSSIQSEEKSNG